MQQFFVVKPDGSRLGPFDGATISQMRLDGAIGVEDTVEEASGGAPSSEPVGTTYPAPPQSAKRMSPIFWVLIGLCVLFIPCIAIVAAVLFPVFSQAKQAARMTATMSNLKQVGTAVAQYQIDFDDQFPLKMDTLSDAWPAIAAYARTAMPESYNPKSPEFEGNGKLAGTLGTKLVAPQRTYEFFDAAPWPTQRRVVLYSDTSVRKVSETQFQDALLHNMIDP